MRIQRILRRASRRHSASGNDANLIHFEFVTHKIDLNEQRDKD